MDITNSLRNKLRLKGYGIHRDRMTGVYYIVDLNFNCVVRWVTTIDDVEEFLSGR
jgi:hypothetical protein